MSKQDSENPADVQGTTAELQSGVSNINRDLFPDLLKIYRSVESLWREYVPKSGSEGELDGIYIARGLVYDLIVSLGYQDRYDEWELEDFAASGLASDEDVAYIRKKLSEPEGEKT